jgi:hypothetical protein
MAQATKPFDIKGFRVVTVMSFDNSSPRKWFAIPAVVTTTCLTDCWSNKITPSQRSVDESMSLVLLWMAFPPGSVLLNHLRRMSLLPSFL